MKLLFIRQPLNGQSVQLLPGLGSKTRLRAVLSKRACVHIGQPFCCPEPRSVLRLAINRTCFFVFFNFSGIAYDLS